jgi:glycosyltransferase involved in cell wall biosynthesis
MRTVVQFIDNLQAGGKERQCVELVKGLVARGDTRCVVVTMTHDLFFTELKSLPNVHIEHLVRRSQRDPRIVWQFWRVCRRWQVDVITCWHVMAALYALPAAVLLRLPMVVNFIQDAPAALPRQLARRSRWAFALADSIVGNSRAGIAAYRPPPAKTRLIPSGFDLARVAQARDANWLRREFGIDTAFIIGMVATFSGFKDHPTLIRAAIEVLARRRDVVFVMVGGGPTQAACEALIPPELSAHIRILGRLAAPIEQVVAGFDIGALATFTEGMSNSIVEYMMLAKPVVASHGGGNAEIVSDGETGWLVPVGDEHAFAGRLLLLLDDTAMRRRMGEAGRARIERDFRMERIVEQYVQAYDAVDRHRLLPAAVQGTETS